MFPELLVAAVILLNNSNTHVIKFHILLRLKIVLNVLKTSYYLVSTSQYLATFSVFYE